MVGDSASAAGGGGFLYTNRDSLSIGLVLRLHDLAAQAGNSVDYFDRYLAHPAVAPYFEGCELVEYGSHLVNEGGRAMVGSLVHDGLVIIGDAAGLTINSGLTVRGMDLAVGSAIAADVGVAQAIETGDTSRSGLSAYRKAFDTSFVGQDLATYARAPKFLENARLHHGYGELASDLALRLFSVNADGADHLIKMARRTLKDSPIKATQLVRDAVAAMRAL
jgi:electron transfer flavoprotein-quinone oxidoreductase